MDKYHNALSWQTEKCDIYNFEQIIFMKQKNVPVMCRLNQKKVIALENFKNVKNCSYF